MNNTFFTNFLTFNYTPSLQRLLSDYAESVRNSIYHIHRSLNTKGIILGVDNDAQISKLSFAADDYAKLLLIKPEQDRQIAMSFGDECMSLIASADIICIYGCSLGITDQKWTKAIANSIRNGARVIYHAYDKDIDPDEILDIQLISIEQRKRLELLAKFDLDPDLFSKYIDVVFNEPLFELYNTL